MKTVQMGAIALCLTMALIAGQSHASMHGKSAGESGLTSMKTSQIMGKAVTDSQGEKVGMVSDLIVGGQGRIDYVIVSPDKSLTEETYNLIPIPWQAVQSETEEALSLAVDRQRLKEAPSFTENEWSQLSSPQWRSRVRGYYGVKKQDMKMQQHKKMKKMHKKHDQ
ncbi:MAG: PRC-barrel domain-containing protein [Thermodesulfobacteriota bacterium]